MVAMVGLPARGKSYLSNKLQRYLLVSRRSLRLAVAVLTRALTHSGSSMR